MSGIYNTLTAEVGYKIWYLLSNDYASYVLTPLKNKKTFNLIKNLTKYV